MAEESIGIGGGAPPRESQYDTREHNVAGGGRQPPFISLWRSRRIVFDKELALHVSISILSITVPFALPVSSPWLAAAIPLSLWCFYVAMFIEGVEHPLHEQRDFDRSKCSAVAAMKILPAWLMSVLSLCFISVVTVMMLTAVMLGGSPLCVASCSSCLASWANAHPLYPDTPSDSNQSCGFANGKELLTYHTFSLITITIYLALMLGLLICLAWRVSDDELAKREDAKARLLTQSPLAFRLREQMISEHGSPESRIHLAPLEAWNIVGMLLILSVASIFFMLMAQSSQNMITTIIIGATVTAGATGFLLLYLSFSGSLIALHKRNLNYVKFVSSVMCESMSMTNDCSAPDVGFWWKLRSFVIENDLPLNTNLARPGLLATIATVIVTFVFATVKTAWENFAIPPSAYLSYSVMMLMIPNLDYILWVADNTRWKLQSQGTHIQLKVENFIPMPKMIALWSRDFRDVQRAWRLMRAEDILVPCTANSSGSQEQPSITGVATHGENSHRGSSGNTEDASSVMRRRREGVFTDMRRINDELNDLFRSPERAMRVVERSADANVTDATQEALRRMLEHIRNEPNPGTLGIPIKTESLRMALILSYVIYAVSCSVSIMKPVL